MTAPTNKYEIKRFDQKLIPELIFLYRSIFNTTYSAEQIEKKYFPKHTGIFAEGHMAFHEGQPVAFHGAIPCWMEFENQKELAIQYGDAMTMSSQRGNRLFTTLGEMTDELFESKGVRFLWGFPNQNSEYGYVHKLNWLSDHRMVGFQIPVSGIPMEAIQRKMGLGSQSQSKIIQKIKPLLSKETVPNSAIRPGFGGMVRDRDFYDYKCFSPNYTIRIADTLVWIKPLGGLLVGDLEVHSEDQVLACLKALQSLSAKLGLNKIVLQCSPGTDLHEILVKHYEAFDSWLVGYRSFSSDFPLEKMRFTFGDLDTF